MELTAMLFSIQSASWALFYQSQLMVIKVTTEAQLSLISHRPSRNRISMYLSTVYRVFSGMHELLVNMKWSRMTLSFYLDQERIVVLNGKQQLCTKITKH
jgi:hypothetical protein